LLRKRKLSVMEAKMLSSINDYGSFRIISGS
jgi:hypothetical protein